MFTFTCCLIPKPGIHNKRPAGQMYAAKAFNLARKLNEWKNVCFSPWIFRNILWPSMSFALCIPDLNQAFQKTNNLFDFKNKREHGTLPIVFYIPWFNPFKLLLLFVILSFCQWRWRRLFFSFNEKWLFFQRERFCKLVSHHHHHHACAR